METTTAMAMAIIMIART